MTRDDREPRVDRSTAAESTERADGVNPREGYEPPKLLWEEAWVPVALAVSCARIPGQSAGCNQVPGT